MEFKACLKKEFLEAKRGRGFYSIFGMGLVFTIVTILYVVIMKFVSSVIQVDDSELQVLFSNTYGSSMSFFGAFMMTYFFLILLYLYSNSISKEVNSKQWILPINAGIKPKNMIGARLISAVLTVAITFIVSAGLHLVLTLLLCESDGSSIGNMFLAYLSMLIFLEFITVTTISLNAISRKRWIAIVVLLATFLIISSTLSNIVIEPLGVMGKITLNDYTPFFFQNYPLTFAYNVRYPLYIWLIAGAGTLIVSGLLVLWALLSFKVKPEKSIVLNNKKGFFGFLSKKNTENE